MICAELVVSLSAAKSHLTNIQAKLGLRNHVETAARAWRCGVVGDRRTRHAGLSSPYFDRP